MSHTPHRVETSGFPALLFDPLEPTAAHAERAFQYHPDPRVWLVPLVVGLFGLALSLVGWLVDPEAFYFAYLTAWVFCVTIALGSLFFVMIQHLTRSHWSVVFRRMPEALVWSFPLLALLALPIFLGMHSLYHWTHHDVDALILEKRPYLNVPFFIARAALYFAVWTTLAHKLYTLSVRQDADPNPDTGARLRTASAWGIPAFAVTTAFFSYDFVMSTDPHWFSTMFGVYIFAGAFWASIAFTILTCLLLQRGGALPRVIRTDHYQDLGKWLFAFTVFWAYIAYSQYMLIWYGNIPEETIWYRHRLEGGWGYHSAALLALHFILPFLILLPRAAKRAPALLAVMSVWALVMQWFDLHWLIMPVRAGSHGGFHWVDFACWLGLFGVFVSVYLLRLRRHSLVPVNDPLLARSMRFENV